MKAPGFSLIEVLLSTAISAILAVMLFGILDQVSKISFWTDDVIGRTIQGMSLCNQLERDLSGAWAPKNVEKGQAIFECRVQDEQLQTLTFITTTTLFFHGSCAQRLVRVLYRLEEEKEPSKSGKKTYRLTRQESDNLDPRAFDPKNNKPIRAYVIARGITRCTITFIAPVETKGKEQKLEKSTIWPPKEAQEKESQDKNDDKKKTPVKLPSLVLFSIIFDAPKSNRASQFSTAVAIPASGAPEEEEQSSAEEKEAPKPAEPKLDDKKTEETSKSPAPAPTQPTPEKSVAPEKLTATTERTTITMTKQTPTSKKIFHGLITSPNAEAQSS